MVPLGVVCVHHSCDVRSTFVMFCVVGFQSYILAVSPCNLVGIVCLIGWSMWFGVDVLFAWCIAPCSCPGLCSSCMFAMLVLGSGLVLVLFHSVGYVGVHL